MLSGAPSSQACPVGCPFKQVPAFVVPIRTIATQRNTAKTLPQEQPRIPRPLAGASAALSAAAPYRSGTHLPEPTVPGVNRYVNKAFRRERLICIRDRLDALSSKFLPLLSPFGQSPPKGTPQNFATRQPRIPRPLAGTSASLPGAAPYRSGTHLPEPTAPILAIAAHGTRGKLPQSVVRCFRVYQVSGRALQIFQAYL